MPARTKSQGESKQGLIITLVFFILATIGLGVATYFGFAEQDKLEQTAKKAETEKNGFKEERDGYKFQAMIGYSYMGKAQGMADVDTLGTLKGQFDSGSMKGIKDKEFVKKALGELDKQLGWNGNQPKDTLAGLLAKANTEIANRDKQIDDLRKEKVRLKKAAEDTDAELKTAKEDFKKQLDAFKDTFSKDFTKSDETLKNYRAEIDKLSAKHTKDLEAAAQKGKDQLAQLKKRDDEIKHLKDRIRAQEDQILAFEVKHEKAPASMRTDWKIIRMDARGLNPYINLGSVDHVSPQLTFTIHHMGVDNRPNPQPKGTLEVINVIGPHLSQTRVTSVKDRSRDPIIEGDIIYNASWNPNLKKHVAIAGIVDLTGDGRDTLYEFMRSLERQHIAVDAYLDPKDGTMKGKITFRTDYLILGEPPDVASGGKPTAIGDKIASGQQLMQAEAKKYGVQVKGLAAYLEMIGYRLPHSIGEKKSSLYNPDLRPDQAPCRGGDKAPPPMRPDK